MDYRQALIGLDLDRYRILASLPYKGLWIIFQASETEYLPYCVEYAGNGRYFSSLEELNMYTLRRWRVCVTEAGRVERYSATGRLC